MIEFIQLCFAPVNLLFTLLLLCAMGYWAMFFVGAVGLDILDDLDVDLDSDVDLDLDLDVDADIDLDVDAGVDLDADVDGDLDADVDTEVDADSEVHTGGRSSMFISLLKFLDVGDVPLMVLLTALVASNWAVAILCSYYFNPAGSILVAVLFFIPDFLVSLLLTKIVTTPARYLFKNTSMGIEKPTKILGKTCTVTTSNVTEKFGQAEIRLDDAAPITLNVRCLEGRKPLSKGDEALILELVEDKGTYIVVPFDLEVN